jgi:hypothetical protein
MATKIDRVMRRLNDEFRDALAAKVREKFAIDVETSWAFLADRIVTERADGEPFTPEQMAYLEAFEAGYLAAMQRVRE